jgi:hypothetical protein
LSVAALPPSRTTFALPNRAPSGRKVSDEFTVPLCRLHHRELHRYGDEASWWAGVNIDPSPIALELWQRSNLTASQAPWGMGAEAAGAARESVRERGGDPSSKRCDGVGNVALGPHGRIAWVRDGGKRQMFWKRPAFGCPEEGIISHSAIRNP